MTAAEQELADLERYPARAPTSRRIVYDAQGKPHEVDSVDAKEYVASGAYTLENPNLGAAPIAAKTEK